jgi:threonine aldolase
MGGGMRQAGYLAAAGIFALQNNIDRLKDDHRKASRLEQMLTGQNFVKEIDPVDTNILIFSLADNLSNDRVLKVFKEEGLLAVDFGPQRIRMVTHLDFSDEDLETVPDVFERISKRLTGN